MTETFFGVYQNGNFDQENAKITPGKKIGESDFAPPPKKKKNPVTPLKMMDAFCLLYFLCKLSAKIWIPPNLSPIADDAITWGGTVKTGLYHKKDLGSLLYLYVSYWNVNKLSVLYSGRKLSTIYNNSICINLENIVTLSLYYNMYYQYSYFLVTYASTVFCKLNTKCFMF